MTYLERRTTDRFLLSGLISLLRHGIECTNERSPERAYTSPIIPSRGQRHGNVTVKLVVVLRSARVLIMDC